MKKILSLFSLLMLFILGAQAEDVVYALSEGDTFTSGQTVDVKNAGGDVVATITYGESGGDDFKAAKKEGSVTGFTAYTEGNGTNGNKTGGTFYTIVPKKDGKISVAVVLNANKAFHIAEDGTDLANYAGITVDAKYNGTYDFDAKAGKSYKVWCDGSKLGFYGFKFTYTEAGGGSAEVTDVLTWEGLGLPEKGTNYADFSDKTFTSSAVYAGQAASGGGKYIQLRTKNSNSGIITTTSGGKLKSVTISFNSGTTDRSIDIYGSNTAYTSAADLYGDNAGTKLGTIAANDNSKTLTVDGDYTFVGLRSTKDAIYVDNISIVWGGSSSGGGSGEGGGESGEGGEEEFQAKKDVMVDFTNTNELQSMGFELPESGQGYLVESPFTYKDITFTPFAGSYPVRIWNSSGKYSLRLYREQDGNKGGIEVTAPTGYKITGIVITGNSELKNVASTVGTDDVSKSSQLTWSPGKEKITTVKFENNGSKTVNINTMTVSLEYIAHLINDTFDFNNAIDAAVANNSPIGNITEVLEINDVEGKNPSGAKLTITPNANVSDYPADVPNRSRFWQTMAGPQLRISGGYTGVTMKIEGVTTELSEIKFNQTNWSRNTKADKGLFDPQTGVWQSEAGTTYTDVTFTIQADTTEVWEKGKLQEIILKDMGLVYINSIEINPLHGVDIAPASGAELSEAIAAERAKVKNAEYIKVTLEAGGQYTVKKKIAFDATVIIEGNGAGIDATDLDEPLIALTAGTTTPKNQDKYTDAATTDFNLLDEITINNVMIKNLKNCIVSTNGQDWAVENLNITNSIIQLDNDSYTFIRFDQTANNKGAIKNLNIQNNTIYNLKENNAGYFIRFANASNAAKAFGTNNGTSTYDFNISNNTIIRTMTAKDFANNMVNNSKVTLKLQNNIFYDVFRLYQFVQGNQMSTTTDNFIYYDVTSPQANDQSRKDKQGNPYTTKLDTAPFDVPTAALDLTKADGGLKLTPKGDASKVGDPRWLGGGKAADETTGIEAVKDAQEDGAWYTIQGVRVAQPTKGLYIHNGKKVILK